MWDHDCIGENCPGPKPAHRFQSIIRIAIINRITQIHCEMLPNDLFKLVCLTIISGHCFGSHAAVLPIEVWARTNSSPHPTALVVDSQGSVIVTGYDYNEPFDEVVTIKHSSAGEPVWTNRFNGQGYYGLGIAANTNGDIFIAGGTSGGTPAREDFFTIKYSSLGLPLWTNYYGHTNLSSRATALAVASNGDVIVTGISYGYGTSSDFATIRYSRSGVPLWVSRYNNLSNSLDEPAAVKVAGNGNIYVTGFSYLGGGVDVSDYATVAYSNTGVALWTNYYNGPADYQDWATDLVIDENSNVFVTGFSRGNQGDDYATLKYSNMGVALWTNRYNGPGNYTDYASSIAVDSNGDVIVTGTSNSGMEYNSGDFATVKYSNLGIPVWTNRLSGPTNIMDSAKGVTTDQLGNIYVIGYVDYGGDGGPADGLMVKYSAAGDTLWTKTFGATSAQPILPTRKAIAIGPDGAVHVAIANGNSVIAAKYSDLVKLEISLSGSTVEVRWPSGALGWRLEAKSALSSGNSWFTVTNSTFTNRIHLPTTNTAEVFRLGTP